MAWSGDAQPLVSVVTPVYNGEAYLAECIESVLAQSYSNWQYTIVNNCSTDATLEIANRYAALDSRIRVHSNTRFLPVIENHNNAFRTIAADSKYCKPLMADDWLFPECLEKMVQCAEKHPSIGLVCTYALSGNYVRFHEGLTFPTDFLSGREVCRLSLLSDIYVFGCPTDMLIRSDLVRRRTDFYNSVNLHADEEACYEILKESDFGFVHQILSFFRRHEFSQTSLTSQFDSIFVGHTYALIKHGRDFLTEEEFRRRSRERIDQYYDILSAAALDLRGRDYWQYHQEKMRLLGYPLDRMRLARAVVGRVVNRVLPLKAIFDWFCRAASRLVHQRDSAQRPGRVTENTH